MTLRPYVRGCRTLRVLTAFIFSVAADASEASVPGDNGNWLEECDSAKLLFRNFPSAASIEVAPADKEKLCAVFDQFRQSVELVIKESDDLKSQQQTCLQEKDVLFQENNKLRTDIQK